jgi:hypothetical protein
MSSSLDDLESYEVFQHELDEYLKEYRTYLSADLKPQTVSKHLIVINGFIEYACFEHSVSGFEEITAGMVGATFTRWLNRNDDENFQAATVKNILKGYFDFIYNTHSIRVSTPFLRQV